jgi:glycine betaine catabolism A
MTTTVKTSNVDDLINFDWHKKYPEIPTGPVPVERYISQSYFEQEIEAVFRHSWIVVGRVQQIALPGDFFVRNLPVLKTSLIIARTEDGSISAMHNMCAHRANLVEWSNDGTTDMFSCKYHGWSYHLDGSVAVVTDEESFPDLDQSKCGLPHVSVDTWGGFIFINLDLEPEESLTEYLGELGRGIENYPWNEFSQLRGHWQAELRCNWKVARDAFVEAYHAGFIHRKILRNSTYDARNPYGHFLDITLYGRHASMSVYKSPEYQMTPTRELLSRYTVPVEPFEIPPGMNPSGSEYWHQDIEMVFPNIVLDPGGGRYGGYYSHTFTPITAGTCLYELDLYHPTPTTAAQRVGLEYARVLLRDAALEDFGNCEKAQIMLASGAHDVMNLSIQELVIRQQLDVVETEIQRYNEKSS